MPKHCDKKKNFTSALFAQQFIDAHRKKHKKLKKLYVYKCHECHYWHLTSRKR